MNFKTYIKLTEYQRREFEFKFRETPKMRFSYWIFLFLVMISINNVLAYAIVFFVPGINPDIKDVAKDSFSQANRALNYVIYLMAFDIIVYIISASWYIYKEHRFYKRHGITPLPSSIKEMIRGFFL